MTSIRIFTASPGDVPEERDIVSVVVEELRRTVAPIISAELETVRWETHAWPDVGNDAQDVINREIGDYDVFVGVMWKRFGTPTKRAGSGTGEEFDRAYTYFRKFQRPKIMFYFRTAPFFTTDPKQLRQFMKVVTFRKKLQDYGVLFWEYEEPIEFERRFREHLTRQLLQLTTSVAPVLSPKVFFSYKREDIDRIEPVYEALKAIGFLPWMDVRDILPGRQWVTEIEAAIRSADFFIPFISRNTVNPQVPSATGFTVGSEVAIALEKLDEELGPGHDFHPDPRSYFIPVRLDPVGPPEAIAKFQWIDLFAPDGQRRLIDTIRAVWKNHRNH
jgi:hypothetical protein